MSQHSISKLLSSISVQSYKAPQHQEEQGLVTYLCGAVESGEAHPVVLHLELVHAVHIRNLHTPRGMFIKED